MARPLKIFTIESRDSFLSRKILDVLEAPAHIQQGDIYIVARTKKDAAERLTKVTGGTVRPSYIQDGRGFHLDAVTEATNFLDDEGDLVAMYRGKVAIARGGEWFLVGETTYKIPGERRLLNKPVFVPVQRPAAPMRITIELDADADPAIIAELIESGKVFLEPSVDSGRFVLGKVVQS